MTTEASETDEGDEGDRDLTSVLDAIAAVDRELAVVSARRAVLVDQARRWSRHAVDAAARGRGREQATTFEHHQAERSLVAEIACALRVPEGTASGLVLESQALVHEHPSTMSRLSVGAFSYRHAQTILDATTGLDESARATLDRTLSARATTSTAAGLRRYARRQREHHDTRPLLERHRVASQDRTVELQPCRDGMAWIHQLLPAVQATAIFHRLSDIATAVQGPDEPRTLAQLRADASVDLLLDDDARAALAAAHHAPVGHAPVLAPGPARPTPAPLAPTPAAPGEGLERPDTSSSTGTGTGTGPGTGSIEGFGGDGNIGTPHTADAPVPSIAGIADRVSLGGIKPQVAVTIPVMTLLGHSDEPGDLAGHGPIDAHTARRLAAQAPSFLRILTHPETGTVLSVGRDRYAVPADLKSWLRIRDETCRFPGCARRAPRCDIDHITDWAHGGTTDHHNLIHLCRKHHRLKHTTAWTVQLEPSSRPAGLRDTGSPRDEAPPSADVVRWTAPTGRHYLDHAAVTIAAGTADVSARDLRSPAHPETGDLATAFPDEPPF